MKVEFKTDNLIVRIPTESIKEVEEMVRPVAFTRITLSSGEYVDVKMPVGEVMTKIAAAEDGAKGEIA